jgi:hypothetical protein
VLDKFAVTASHSYKYPRRAGDLTPVCEGTHYVTIRGTYVNSIVVLFRNVAIAGMAGGVLGDLKIARWIDLL